MIVNALASVAVRDLNKAVDWYENVLGRAASRPMPDVAEWQFERGGGLQVYQLPERAGSGSLTLAVSSIQDQIAELDKLKVDTRARTTSAQVKTVMVTDPDGNHIAFAEALDPGWHARRRLRSFLIDPLRVAVDFRSRDREVRDLK